MLSLALALALTQYPQHRLFKQPSLPTASYAFFEAFSGAGTTTACSTTAPTGARGEALTFTRTGSATCTKTASGGLATTGIADGDLVSLSGNVARVEYDSAGVLGLRVESSRTNSLLRSEEISNAAWTKLGTVIAAPTVTADFSNSPSGTTTADRVQLAASSGASQTSLIRQTVTTTGGAAYTCTVYVRGNGTSGTTYINNSLAAGGSTPGSCAYVSGSWTRCSFSFNAGGVADGCDLGTNTFLNIATTQPTHDLLVWGFQLEAGAYATSYIPTTTASAVRNSETATFTVSLATAGGFSLAGTVAPLRGNMPSEGQLVSLYLSDAQRFHIPWIVGSTSLRATLTSAGATINTANQSGVDGALERAALWWDASTLNLVRSGTTTSVARGGVVTDFTATTIGIGSVGSFVNRADAIVSRVCLDPSPTRCR